MERFGERRAVLAQEEEPANARNLIGDRFHTANEFRAENEEIDVREPDAVFDFVGRVPEIERHGDPARLQRAEVDREPFEAVHEQNTDLVALFKPPAEQEIREPVRERVELRPGRRPAVAGRRAFRRLNEIEIFPGNTPGFVHLGIDLNETNVRPVQERVALQNFGNRRSFFNRGKIRRVWHNINLCNMLRRSLGAPRLRAASGCGNQWRSRIAATPNKFQIIIERRVRFSTPANAVRDDLTDAQTGSKIRANRTAISARPVPDSIRRDS